MHEVKLAGVFILVVTSVCVRCSSRIRPLHRDVPAWNCDPENKNTLAEIKSDIQNLQQLVVGLRQKLDPDFKLTTPRK